MHYYLGQLEDSIENHRNATEIEVNDHLAWSNLGDALWNSGDTEGARSAFEKARSLADDILRVNPNDAFIMMDLAWIHSMLGSEEKATSLMSRAIELAPNDPYTHYYSGLMGFRSNDIDGAIDALETAVHYGYPIALLGAEPHLAELHSNKRFIRLLSQN